MSYQARMAMPPLIVTGRTGACGNTKRKASPCGQSQLGDDRLEIMAVGAEAMQPDHTAGRSSGFDLYCLPPLTFDTS